MVFVDPSVEGWWDDLAASRPPEGQLALASRRKAAAAALTGAAHEEQQAYAASEAEVRQAWPLPCVPVVLITAMNTYPGAMSTAPSERQLWFSLHSKFLARVPDADHIVSSTARHYIQNDQPDLVVDAIKEVLAKAKRHQFALHSRAGKAAGRRQVRC
jgi:pimeloyl-ACP methyl ester carboxylesterase